jgi:subfamily B ATP-binding cassette protein MsbA
MEGVTQRIVADVRKRLFSHLLNADLAFFHATSSGALISRMMNDVALLHMAVGKTLTGFGKDLLTLLALIGVMFYQDWALALASFFAFPTAILPIARIGKRMRKVSGNSQAEMSRLTSHLDETFQGIRHVKAYTTEAYEAERGGRLVDIVARLGIKAARTRGLSHPIMETLGGIAIVVVIGYGGWQVIEGARTTGSFFSFVVALMLAYEPLKRLVSLNANLQEGWPPRTASSTCWTRSRALSTGRTRSRLPSPPARSGWSRSISAMTAVSRRCVRSALPCRPAGWPPWSVCPGPANQPC